MLRNPTAAVLNVPPAARLFRRGSKLEKTTNTKVGPTEWGSWIYISSMPV
jgi:hypothetical protein